jgi:hypothetical protein
VGLSVTLAAPATAVRATVADATALLDDPVWSGPARDGTRTLFAGFLMVPGLAPDAPSWAGDPPVTARVVLEITGADGLVATVTTEVPLRPGWG